MKQSIYTLFFLVLIFFVQNPVLTSQDTPPSFFSSIAHLVPHLNISSLPLSYLYKYGTSIMGIGGKYSYFCAFTLLYYAFHKKCKNIEKRLKIDHKKFDKKTRKKIEEIEKKQGENNHIIKKVIKQCNQTFESIQTMNSQISNMQNDTSDIKIQLCTIEEEASKTNGNIKYVQQQCKLIDEKIDNNNNKINLIEALTKKNEESLLNIINQIALLNDSEKTYIDKIHTLQNTLENNIKTMKEMNNQTNELSVNYSEMKNVLDTLKKDTGNIKTNIETTHTQNNDIKKLVTERYNEIKNEYTSVKQALETFKNFSFLLNNPKKKH